MIGDPSKVAVLAATLENLVHEESITNLGFAFRAHGIMGDGGSLAEEQVEEVKFKAYETQCSVRETHASIRFG